MKWIFEFLSGVIYKIYFRIRLRHMDSEWYYWNETGFSLFPPSFYYTHTEEEIKRITEETITEVADYDIVLTKNGVLTTLFFKKIFYFLQGSIYALPYRILICLFYQGNIIR